MMSFYDLNVFDLFYVLQSDYLRVDHEKYILYYLYRYLVDKTEKEIYLLVKAIRFEFLDLKEILNFARDHKIVKQNSYFRKKL